MDGRQLQKNQLKMLICGKDLTEEDFKEAFEAHGTVEKIEIHKDKNGNSKGLYFASLLYPPAREREQLWRM